MHISAGLERFARGVGGSRGVTAVCCVAAIVFRSVDVKRSNNKERSSDFTVDGAEGDATLEELDRRLKDAEVVPCRTNFAASLMSERLYGSSGKWSGNFNSSRR